MTGVPLRPFQLVPTLAWSTEKTTACDTKVSLAGLQYPTTFAVPFVGFATFSGGMSPADTHLLPHRNCTLTAAQQCHQMEKQTPLYLQ